jgi:hypothetical protein
MTVNVQNPDKGKTPTTTNLALLPQVPPYLDDESQERQHEVDVPAMIDNGQKEGAEEQNGGGAG